MPSIQRAHQHWLQSPQMAFQRSALLSCGLLTERRQVEIHTDTLTPKVEELRVNNRAALHVWIRKSMLQLRLEVCFDILTGLDVEERWNAVPPASRISYGTHPVPGQPIAGPFDYEKPAEQARFAVLKGHVQRIEVLYLGAKHQRALFKRNDDWCGQWIAP